MAPSNTGQALLEKQELPRPSTPHCSHSHILPTLAGGFSRSLINLAVLVSQNLWGSVASWQEQ